MIPRIALLVVFLLMSLAGNFYQYSYFDEKVESLETELDQQSLFYQDVVNSQSHTIQALQRQSEIERQVSIGNKQSLEKITKATQQTADKLELLGKGNEDVQNWYDSPIPSDVVRLLNESAGEGESNGGELPVPAGAISRADQDSFVKRFRRPEEPKPR